jgi:ribose 5-phosphate isomerase B
LSERVYVGADHAGFALKQALVAELRRLGYDPVDVGPATHDPADDYPDFAKPVAAAVSGGEARRGVLTCGTGLGMAVAANRYRHAGGGGVEPGVAELSRRHNDANVLVLPARFVSDAEGTAILRRFLETTFEGGRHQRRVEKLDHA